MSLVDDLILSDAAFAEIPGMRGLRVAQLGSSGPGGKLLEVVEGARGVIIPAMTTSGATQVRVLSGSLRFMQEGVVKLLQAGNRWTVPAGTHHGPHIVLEDGTRLAILRDASAEFDVV